MFGCVGVWRVGEGDGRDAQELQQVRAGGKRLGLAVFM